MRTVEKEYYCELLTIAKRKIKSTWKEMNADNNKKTNTSQRHGHFKCNGINVISNQSIADQFNKFAVGLGSNLVKKTTVVVADGAASIYCYGTSISQLVFINPVSEDELVKIM